METKTALDQSGDSSDARTAALLGNGPGDQKIAVRVEARLVIGRANDVDLQIDDSDVSRRHARITQVDAEVFELRDLGSKNGTQVNGQGIQAHILRAGDIVKIGPADLEFRFVTEAEFERAERASEAGRNLRSLTARELEVARLVASGAKNADIARQLEITSRTVAAHLEHIFARLGITSRTALTRLVIEAGLEV